MPPSDNRPCMIEHDATMIAARIREDFGDIPEPVDWIWTQSTAAKVLDCVLSLRKKYDTVVEPRVKGFVTKHPHVQTCADLRSLIDSTSPEAFLHQHLNMRSPGKAQVISDLVDHLIDTQRRFDGSTEQERLSTWARWVRPGDYLSLDIRGFGLAGFQYLRMLFGADTVKPDVHVIRYVESALGRPVSDIRAVYVLERAGELLDQPVRHIDVAIWTRGARQAPAS